MTGPPPNGYHTIMNKPGYYSSGQFALLADVSVRTIRYYDRQNILKPSLVNENGARFYTDADLVRLQQILLLKYLGFSLEDIRAMTLEENDPAHLLSSLRIQLKLVQDRIEQMQTVEEAIRETTAELSSRKDGGELNWRRMLDLIHLTGMERSLAGQYKNASNLSARVALHSRFSVNRQGWFPWIFEKMNLREGMRVLELGCGDGALWTSLSTALPRGIEICLSDISDGMVRDARRNIRDHNDPEVNFSYYVFDCAHIPFEKDSFDLVVANHVLFYCEDIPQVLKEVRRVLKIGGTFLCSAYGKDHMQEITSLVQSFDSHIVLSANRLYERFGLENGAQLLGSVFDHVREERYEDRLIVTDAQALISYILSCHGNQNRYLVDRYREFRAFVEARIKKGFSVTKNAGIFLSD